MSEQSKQKLQEKYVLYQLLNQNLESLKQQQDMIQQQFIELKSTVMSISDTGSLKESNEILVPLGGGCFGKGTVTDSKNVIVSIGSGLFMTKKSESAKSYIEDRLNEIEMANKEIQGHMERIARQMNDMGAEIQELSRQHKKP